jgi:ABC-type phosphate/phosphonate transport system substrate-binding protein
MEFFNNETVISVSQDFLLTICTTAVVNAVIAQQIVLAINEGVTYQDAGTPGERYKPLLGLLTKELKRPVTVKNISRYSEFEKGLSENLYALAFIHSAHVGTAHVGRQLKRVIMNDTIARSGL